MRFRRVLHHLARSACGFKSLSSKVSPGGTFRPGVYGAENNEWITRWVESTAATADIAHEPEYLVTAFKNSGSVHVRSHKLIMVH